MTIIRIRRIQQIIVTALLLLIPTVTLAAEFMQGGEGGGQAVTLWTVVLTPKYGLFLLFIVVGSILIWAGQMKRPVRMVMMGLSVIIFGGIVFGMHPSPVCATTKPFIYGLRVPFLALILFAGVTTLLVNKAFCGTACPGGGLQEFLYWLPIVKKGQEKKKIPFGVSNTVRIGIAALFLILVTTVKFPVYEYINFFELFHWTLPPFSIMLLTLLIVVIGFLVFSLFYYRPFCYLICPMGLMTWVLEQFSLSRVQIDADTCTDCGTCTEQSPCPAIESIKEERTIRGDCHLCGECLEVCPEESLSFGLRKKN